MQEVIPWEALEFLIGQINYGGRVTDDLDRRCLTSILRQFVDPRIVTVTQAPLSSDLAYSVPPDGPLESYREFIRGLPR